jgi:hypothetical protein
VFTLADAKVPERVFTAFENKVGAGTAAGLFVSTFNVDKSSVQADAKSKSGTKIKSILFILIKIKND